MTDYPLIPMDRTCLNYLAQHDGTVPADGIPARLFVGEIPAGHPDMVDLGLIRHVGADDIAITDAGLAALAEYERDNCISREGV